MRGIAALLFMATVGLAGAQFARSGVRLAGWMPLHEMPGNPGRTSGCAGYTSPSGREYAVVGVDNGTSIVEITGAPQLRGVGHIPGPQSNWHEVAVLGDYAYAVSEGGGGIQVIDLRAVDAGVVTLATTFRGGGLDRIHTIQANDASQSLFVNGSNLGFLVIDARNPLALAVATRWTQSYVHDCQVATMPSGPWAGREIGFLSLAEAGFAIADLTDRPNVTILGTTRYPSLQYCHSGAYSADFRTYFVNDELDERNGLVSTSTTIILDITDFRAPRFVRTFTNGVPSIDHNSWMREGYMHMANNASGYRVYDARDPAAMRETGFLDTYPEGDGTAFEGPWGVYAGFPSGLSFVSDRRRGVIVLDPGEAVGDGATLISVRASRGDIARGGVAELRKSDDDRLQARSVAGAFPTEANLNELLVDLETTRSPTTLGLEIEASADDARIELRAALLEWSTGRYVEVGRSPLSLSDQVASFEVADAVRFAQDSNGTRSMRLRLTSVGPATLARASFSTFLDRVKLDVR